jgi:MoxR-like ATPase
MNAPTKFEITKLFGNRDISISASGDALILVGPNGIGKSSVASIFYFFVSRQWRRLSEYDFSEVAVWFGNDEIRAAKSDIMNLSQVTSVIEAISTSSLLSRHLNNLKSVSEIGNFVYQKSMNGQVLRRYSEILGVSPD